MALNSDLLDIIDARVAAAMPRVSAVGTIIEWAPPSAMVLFDGSNLAVPVKVFNDVDGRAGDRCGLMKFGNDWAVTGSFGARWPVQSGDVSVAFTTLTVYLQTVNFPKAFANPPRMAVNIASGDGDTAQWHARADTQTTTSFRLFLFRTAGQAANSWSGHKVHWVAVDPGYRQ